MKKNAFCPIEDVMQFACALEVGSIFTLETLLNQEGPEENIWPRLLKADRKDLSSQWAAWARDGLVLSKGVLRPYGKLISGEPLYFIDEWDGDED
jgi:hypothetical protein